MTAFNSAWYILKNRGMCPRHGLPLLEPRPGEPPMCEFCYKEMEMAQTPLAQALADVRANNQPQPLVFDQ